MGSVFSTVQKFCSPPSPDIEPAYCVPCESTNDPTSPAGKALKRQATRHAMPPNPALLRQPSRLDDATLPWRSYAQKPTHIHDAAGFNAAGVQRIDLPYGPHELEAVAHAVSSEHLGLDKLGSMHRLHTPERLARWREEFGSLDLGEYDDAAAAPEGSKLATLFSRLRWSILLVEPNRFFPAHQHPDIEIEFVLRGALYENRLLAQPDRMITAGQLPDFGLPKLFRVKRHGGAAFFSNPRYSVHQSYTLDEGVVILVLWCGNHNNLTDKERALWDARRCQNPLCALAGHQGISVQDYLEKKSEEE